MWWCDIRWQLVVSVETSAIVISHQHFFIAVVSRGGLISFCQETVVQAIFGGWESSRHILSTSHRHEYRRAILLAEIALEPIACL